MKIYLSFVLMFCSILFLWSQPLDYMTTGVRSYLVNYHAIKCNTFLLRLSQKRFQFLDEATKCDLEFLKSIGSKMPVLHYKDIVAIHPSNNEYKIVNLDEDAFLHSSEPSALAISFKNNKYHFYWLPDRRTNLSLLGYRFYYSINTDSTADFTKLDTLIKTNSLTCDLPKSTKWVKVKTVIEGDNEISYGSPVKLYYSSAEPVLAADIINEERKNDTLTHNFQFLSLGDVSPDSIIILIDYNRNNIKDQFIKFKMDKNKEKWNFSQKIYLDPQIKTSGGYEFYLDVYYQGKKKSFPSSGFISTNINNRIKNDYYGFFIMNVGSNTWRNAYIQEVHNSINSLGYGGLFEDDTWYQVSRNSGDCYPPFGYRDSLWFKYLNEFLKEIKSSLKNYPVYFNGLYSRNALGLLNYTDGGMTEGFAYTHWSKFVSRTYWEELCNIGIECQKKYNKNWLALGGIINNDPIPRLYVLSSYLLVSDINSYYANATNYQTFAHYPEFDIPLGLPKKSADSNINELKMTYKSNNTDYFLRWFDKGLVAVNPNNNNYVLINGLKNYLKVEVDDKLTINGGRLRTVQASDTLHKNEGHIYLEKPPDGKGLFSPFITDYKTELIEFDNYDYKVKLTVSANDSSSKFYMKDPNLPLYIYADLSPFGGASELVLENDKTPASEKPSEYSQEFLLPYGSISKDDSFYIAVLSPTGLIYVNKIPLNIKNPDSLNLIRNFSYEIDGNLDGLPDFWRIYYKGFQYDTSGLNAYSGRKSIYIKNDIDTLMAGTYTAIDVNQEEAEPLQISGWSKSINVSGLMNNDYSIYADIRYNDDTYLYGQTARFNTGSHDWEYSEKIIEPQKPIKKIYLYALFRRKTGEVWFDHLYLGKPKETNKVISEYKQNNILHSFYDVSNKNIIIKSEINFDKIRVFNYFGKELVINNNEISLQRDNITINAENLSKGVYLILMKSNNTCYSTKVFIY